MVGNEWGMGEQLYTVKHCCTERNAAPYRRDEAQCSVLDGNTAVSESRGQFWKWPTQTPWAIESNVTAVLKLRLECQHPVVTRRNQVIVAVLGCLSRQLERDSDDITGSTSAGTDGFVRVIACVHVVCNRSFHDMEFDCTPPQTDAKCQESPWRWQWCSEWLVKHVTTTSAGECAWLPVR